MTKKIKFIVILALSAITMMLSSCSTILSTAYAVSALSGGANLERYTGGYNPIPLGNDAYITPGKSEKVEYGISLEKAKKMLPSYVKVTRVLGVFRDPRGCIGWAFVCYNTRNLVTGEYTVTKYGYVPQ